MIKALQTLLRFFDTYFEPVKAQKISMLLRFNLADTENNIPAIRERAVQAFGSPALSYSMDWCIPDDKFQQVTQFLLDGIPWPKKPVDPIWLLFGCDLVWKASVLPNIDLPDGYFDGSDQKMYCTSFDVRLMDRGYISFGFGIQIPISCEDPASFEFLQRFSADAPFKMNPKNFSMLVPVGSKGKWAWRRPDGVDARLREVIR